MPGVNMGDDDSSGRAACESGIHIVTCVVFPEDGGYD
jgi:hypothetical protein